MIQFFVWSFGAFLGSPLLLEPALLAGCLMALRCAWKVFPRMK